MLLTQVVKRMIEDFWGWYGSAKSERDHQTDKEFTVDTVHVRR
jgi:hypothetical protein